jgi:hypothetical protein
MSLRFLENPEPVLNRFPRNRSWKIKEAVKNICINESSLPLCDFAPTCFAILSFSPILVACLVLHDAGCGSTMLRRMESVFVFLNVLLLVAGRGIVSGATIGGCGGSRAAPFWLDPFTIAQLFAVLYFVFFGANTQETPISQQKITDKKAQEKVCSKYFPRPKIAEKQDSGSRVTLCTGLCLYFSKRRCST